MDYESFKQAYIQYSNEEKSFEKIIELCGGGELSEDELLIYIRRIKMEGRNRVAVLLQDIFGILLFASFAGTFLAHFHLPRFIIDDHNFNTPALSLTLCFFCFFIIALLRIISPEKYPEPENKKSVIRGMTLPFIILPFVILMGYFSLYLPLTSHYFGEIDFTLQQEFPITISTKTKVYFEFDTGFYTMNGTKVKATILGKNDWKIQKTYTMAKKDKKDKKDKIVVSGTTITPSIGILPIPGEYVITFEQLDRNTEITSVRIFGKETKNEE